MTRRDYLESAAHTVLSAYHTVVDAVLDLRSSGTTAQADAAGLPCLQRAIEELRQAQQRIAAAIDAEGKR